jgi:hypothetical protein
MVLILKDLTNTIRDYVINHKNPTDIVVSLYHSDSIIDSYIQSYISLYKLHKNEIKTREQGFHFVRYEVSKWRPIKQLHPGGYAIILFNNNY